SAALHIYQRVVPGVADLPGEETDGVDLCEVVVGNQRNQARIRTPQIGPIALRLDAEHPVHRLPAITDLAADQTAARGVTALARRRRNSSTSDVGEIPAPVTRRAATVETDIKDAPVVDRCDDWRGFGVGPRRKVGGRCRARKSGDREQSSPDNSKTMHSSSSASKKAQTRSAIKAGGATDRLIPPDAVYGMCCGNAASAEPARFSW